MTNSVYGKTMENLRKRINVRLANNEKYFLKYTSRPTPITHKIFDKNYTAIHETKPILTLNKPIYVGFIVQELSKWLMYDFHYNFIKNILTLNCYLLTQTVLRMKSNQNIFMNNFLSANTCSISVTIQKIKRFLITCFISVTIQKIKRFLITLIKKLLAK